MPLDLYSQQAHNLSAFIYMSNATQALDPRFSNGGFYGRGIYLAANPSYPIGGRYGHRLPGFGGRRIQLLVVRAALGTVQDLGKWPTPQLTVMAGTAGQWHALSNLLSLPTPQVLQSATRPRP